MIAGDKTSRWTRHAASQAQRRGIPPGVDAFLDQYGRREPAPGGGEIVFFDRESFRELRAEYGKRLASVLVQGRGIYKYESGDGVVVTIGHRHRRIKRA